VLLTVAIIITAVDQEATLAEAGLAEADPAVDLAAVPGAVLAAVPAVALAVGPGEVAVDPEVVAVQEGRLEAVAEMVAETAVAPEAAVALTVVVARAVALVAVREETGAAVAAAEEIQLPMHTMVMAMEVAMVSHPVDDRHNLAMHVTDNRYFQATMTMSSTTTVVATETMMTEAVARVKMLSLVST